MSLGGNAYSPWWQYSRVEYGAPEDKERPLKSSSLDQGIVHIRITERAANRKGFIFKDSDSLF